MLESRQVVRCASPQGSRSLEFFLRWSVVVKMKSTIHGQRPEMLVKLFRPTQSSMEQENAGTSCDIFNCIFCWTILVMGTNTTHPDRLLCFLELHCELFCSIHAIVRVVTGDFDLGTLSLPLKSKQGANSFIGSEAKLVMDGDATGSSITENGATSERIIAILASIPTIEIWCQVKAR